MKPKWMRYGTTMSQFRVYEPKKPIKRLMGGGEGARATPEARQMQSIGMKPTASGVAVCKEGEAFHLLNRQKPSTIGLGASTMV